MWWSRRSCRRSRRPNNLVRLSKRDAQDDTSASVQVFPALVAWIEKIIIWVIEKKWRAVESWSNISISSWECHLSPAFHTNLGGAPSLNSRRLWDEKFEELWRQVHQRNAEVVLSLYVDVTVVLDTAHGSLSLSNDGNKVREDKWQKNNWVHQLSQGKDRF